MDLSGFIQGNSSVQLFVASERRKQGFHLVSPQAREAILEEIVPQIEDRITSVEVLNEIAADMQSQIRDAFEVKNQIYTRLIRYKSLDQADQGYAEDLVEAMGDWAVQTRNLLEEKLDPPAPETKTVKVVKVKVEEKLDPPAPETKTVKVVKVKVEEKSFEFSTTVTDDPSQAPPVGSSPKKRLTKTREDVSLSNGTPFDLNNIRL